ncbi:unnamed protein product [Linum tenue]|uniref:Uncharacterized protein n=1 Tax=Linum tenue TaxID=586396 RepID=A0AAV0M555_9ROSI|nr:unnamed protein product [Linum tenue]
MEPSEIPVADMVQNSDLQNVDQNRGFIFNFFFPSFLHRG